MNILITGANGQLGREIWNVVREKSQENKQFFDNLRFIYTDLNAGIYEDMDIEKLDICNKEEVFNIIDSKSIDYIINCAAYTNVEKAEEEPKKAYEVNVLAAGYLAEAAREYNAKLIHISTDFVFDGASNIPYKEFDSVNPLSVYGKTKYEGERRIIEYTPVYMILRTAWLYSPYGKNYVKTMLELCKTKEFLNAVQDMIGSPTYALDLAEFIVYIVSNDKLSSSGLYHYTNEGICSRYDLSYAIKSLSFSKAQVYPCSSEFFPSKAIRPNYSVLDKTLIKETFGVQIPHWFDSLKKCLDRIK